jgi:hypothetical protein
MIFIRLCLTSVESILINNFEIGFIYPFIMMFILKYFISLDDINNLLLFLL